MATLEISRGKLSNRSTAILTALLGGGLLAFEWGGGGNFHLGARERLTRARKLGHALHIITGRLSDPHSAISINNIEHIVHRTGTHGDEGNIGKRTSVLHRDLPDVQAFKTTRPTVLLESQGAALVDSENFFITVKKRHIKSMELRGSQTQIMKSSRAQKRAEMLHHPRILGYPQTKGDQIRIGCLTPAFSGPKEGGSAMSPLHSQGSPTPSAGTKSEPAHRWARCLHACILSKISNFFFALRSCNFCCGKRV